MDAPVHTPVVEVLPLIREASIALDNQTKETTEVRRDRFTPYGYKGFKLVADIMLPCCSHIQCCPALEAGLTFLVCGRRQNRSLIRPQNTTMDSLHHHHHSS